MAGNCTKSGPALVLVLVLALSMEAVVFFLFLFLLVALGDGRLLIVDDNYT
jgi:hypothetical protein